MCNLNEVTQIRYRSSSCYHIVFDDGTSGDVDFSEYLDKGSVFAPLRDVDFFQQARIEGGTISWPNGTDVVPESLYENLERTRGAAGPAANRPRRRAKGRT